MNYSEDLGLIPLTREQYLTKLYNSLTTLGVIDMTFTDFKGTNWHKLFSSSTLPQIEQLQGAQLDAMANLFTYWDETNKAVRGSFGSSHEGWANNFSPYCRGLNLVDSQLDPTLGVAGNIALYFDELDTVAKRDDIMEAFRRSVWPGMVTPIGDETIELQFTSAGAKSYQFFNLREEDYTKIDVRITLTYKANSVKYEPEIIREAFLNQFNEFNAIGKSFYPEAFFDTTQLPNVADFETESRLTGESTWQATVRLADFGQKFRVMNSYVVVTP